MAGFPATTALLTYNVQTWIIIKTDTRPDTDDSHGSFKVDEHAFMACLTGPGRTPLVACESALFLYGWHRAKMLLRRTPQGHLSCWYVTKFNHPLVRSNCCLTLVT
jgi:hypothetical protein